MPLKTHARLSSRSRSRNVVRVPGFHSEKSRARKSITTAALPMKREPWRDLKRAVGSEQPCTDLHRRRRDPEIVRVAALMKRMRDTSAGVAQFGDGSEQAVAHWHNRRFRDRRLQVFST